MPDVRLTISGDASGAVAAARQAETATTNLGNTAVVAGKKMDGMGELAIPNARKMKNLSMAAFQLTNQMDLMGGSMGQVGAAMRMFSWAMNGAIGPVGLVLIAVGGLALMQIELAKETDKAREALMKQSDALLAVIGNDEALIDKNRELLESILLLKKATIEKTKAEADSNIGGMVMWNIQDKVKSGLLRTSGALLGPLGIVTGLQAHNRELQSGARFLVEFSNRTTHNTTEIIKAEKAYRDLYKALHPYSTEKEKPEATDTGAGGGAKKVVDPEEAWYKRRLETLKNFEKEVARITEQAKKDREEFDKAYEDEVQAREDRKKTAYETMRVKSSGDQLLTLNREKVILLRYTNDKLAVEEYYQRRKKQIEAQIIRDSIDNMVKRAMIATSLASALIGAANMSAKGEAEAQMALAGIKALIEGAAAAAAMASALEGKPGMWAAAAQHAIAAMEYAAVARQQYKTAYGGGGGAGEIGGGSTGEGQGGATESPRAPTGPVTYYIFSSWTVNGNVIGYDDLYSMWEEFYLRHLRAGGGDINRG